MINIPPIKPRTEIKTEVLPDIGKTWKIGQLLNATAETGGDTLSKIVLRIGQQLIETRTPVPIKAGEQLKLLVKTIGDTPLLSIQSPAPHSSIGAEKLRGFIAQQQNILPLLDIARKVISNNNIPAPSKKLLQQLLTNMPTPAQLTDPKQIKQLIQNSGVLLEGKLLQNQLQGIQLDTKGQLLRLQQQLQAITPGLNTRGLNTPDINMHGSKTQGPSTQGPSTHSSATGNTNNNIPSEKNVSQIQQAIKQFINSDINIKQLVQVLSNNLSRPQLEAIQQYLNQPGKNLLPDSLSQSLELLVKRIQQQSNPRQFIDTITQLLKNQPQLLELRSAVENVLAQISSQQLTPTIREGDNLLLLLFGLAIRDDKENQLINFRIEQENKANEQQQSNWTATLNFSFPSLGDIQAKIHLIDNRIATVFHAEQKHTVDKINQHIAILEKGLKQAGLDVIKIDVSHGKPETQREIPDTIHILDEEA